MGLDESSSDRNQVVLTTAREPISERNTDLSGSLRPMNFRHKDAIVSHIRRAGDLSCIGQKPIAAIGFVVSSV